MWGPNSLYWIYIVSSFPNYLGLTSSPSSIFSIYGFNLMFIPFFNQLLTFHVYVSTCYTHLDISQTIFLSRDIYCHYIPYLCYLLFFYSIIQAILLLPFWISCWLYLLTDNKHRPSHFSIFTQFLLSIFFISVPVLYCVFYSRFPFYS